LVAVIPGIVAQVHAPTRDKEEVVRGDCAFFVRRWLWGKKTTLSLNSFEGVTIAPPEMLW
jgi:hypothetical protein